MLQHIHIGYGKMVYNGLMTVGVKPPPPGRVYNKFRQDIIDAFQDPVFDHLPHLSADASIDDVDIYAGEHHTTITNSH